MFIDFLKEALEEDLPLLILMAYLIDSDRPVRESKLSELTGLSDGQVSRALKEGLAQGYINHHKKGGAVAFLTKKGVQYVTNKQARWITNSDYWFMSTKS
jgi:Mn-dependent DtxR family transcriptional regulator